MKARRKVSGAWSKMALIYFPGIPNRVKVYIGRRKKLASYSLQPRSLIQAHDSFSRTRASTKRAALTKIAHGQKFVGQAPLVIAACALTDAHVMSCGQLSYTIDVAIALEHIALAATAEGLATCWIGAFDEEPVKKLLGIPADVRVVQLMPLGYAADKRGPGTRMALRDILMHDEWSG